MPDIYNSNIPISSPSQSQNFDTSAGTITKLQPIVLPYTEEGDSKPLSDLDIMKNSFDTAISSVGSQPWAKAEKFTQAFVKTPLKETLRYDNPAIGYNPLDPDLEQKYAADQGTVHRFLNRLAKFGATAAVSALDTIDATINFLSGQDAVTSSISTDANNWLQDLDNFKMPNYQTQYQKEHPYLSYFTPWNFKSWVDNIGNVGQQLGYTVGAIAATVPIDLALGAIGGEALDALLLPKQLEKVFAGLGKFSRLVADGGEEYNAFIKTVNSSENVVKGINKALTTASNFKKGVDMTRFLTGVTISAYGESIVEGNNTYSQIRKDLQSQYTDEFGNFNGGDELRNQIDETAKAGAKSIIAPNFAFLALSNAIGYSSILKPAQAAIRETEATLASEARIALDKGGNINKFTSTPVKGVWSKLTKPTSLLADNLREGFEEGYQYMFSNTAQNYYEKQFNHDSNKETISLANEYGKSFRDLFGTREGFDNIFLGFLSGFAQHGVKSLYNKMIGNGQSAAKLSEQIVNNLNSVGVTDLFSNTRKEAATAVQLANEITQANEKGDIFQYKNLQHEQLFNFVSTAVNSHKFDARIEQLEALKNLSPENFNLVFGVESTPLNQQSINQYVDNIIEKSKDMKNDIERINYVFGENPFSQKKDNDNYDAFNNYKTELALNLSKQKDLIKRTHETTEAISAKVPTASVEDIYNLSTQKGVEKNIKDYEHKIKELENSERLAEGNRQLTSGYRKEREFLQDKVQELRGNIKDFDPDMYIQTLKDLYNYHSNLNSLTGNTNISELDVLSTYNISKDLNKLIDTTKDTAHYYTALAKKSGFDEFKGKYITARNRAYSLLTNQIDVDANGNMFFKPDEPVVEEVTPKSEEELNNELDKIDEASPEEIAKIMNPNYANEPESEEYKIANGEVEVTDDIREAAKERVRSQNEVKKTPATTTQAPVPQNETPDERKARRASIQANDEVVEVDYEVRTEKPTVAPQTSPEKYWDGLFSPIKMLFKITSLPARKDFKIDYRANLRTALFGTNSKEGVDKLVNSVNLEITESTEGLVAGEFGKYPIQGNIYRKGQKYQIVANAGTKPIGILNEPDSLYYKDGDQFKPLHEIDSPTKYQEVTGNPANTFAKFKEEMNSYREGYNKILAKGVGSKVTNEELQAIFKPVVSYGSIDYSTKATDSTILKDLKYKGKGSAIISFPMIYNETTDQYERQNFPNILNEKELSVEDIAAVADFFEKNKDLANLQNTRYAYLMKMPDGTFSKQSFIVARPANESQDNVDDFFNDLKLSLQEAREQKFTLKSINEVLGNALYISHSKQADKRRTHIRFSVSKKGGDLALNIVNKQLKISSIIYITEEELNGIENMDSFIDYINNRIKAKEQTNTPLRSLGISINKDNFKKHLPNDREIEPDALRESLAASVKSNVFVDYSMTLTPTDGRKAAIVSPEKAIPTSKTPTEQKVKPVVEKVVKAKKETKVNPKIIEVNDKYRSDLKPYVEKRLNKTGLTNQEVLSNITSDDVISLLKYYEKQREAQAGNYLHNPGQNFSANTSFWDKKIKDLRQYLKLQKKKVAKKDNIVSKDQAEAFKKTNHVSEDMLQDIAEKVKDGDTLTPEEIIIYDAKKSDVDAIAAELKDAETHAIDLTSAGVQEGEKLIPMEEPEQIITKESPDSKNAPKKAVAPAKINFDIEDIIKQLESKGIVKKDCK